ncbi:MAG: class I SAM-dependent methyltransferase [Anaerolineales bacterium]|nr:class I SAM-dependent methyltransferase [Anaerolineales bacterium]
MTTALNAGVQSIVILGTGFDSRAYRVTDLDPQPF